MYFYTPPLIFFFYKGVDVAVKYSTTTGKIFICLMEQITSNRAGYCTVCSAVISFRFQHRISTVTRLVF